MIDVRTDGEGERWLAEVEEARGPSLADRLGRRIERLRFAGPLGRMRLAGRFPLRLLAVPQDPMAGNAERAERLVAGRLYHAGYGESLVEPAFADRAPEPWQRFVHGWEWLRDAALVEPLPEPLSQRIEGLAKRWLAAFPDYAPGPWDPDLTGRRLMLALAHAPLVMPRQDHIHRSAVLSALARWARHLDRAAPGMTVHESGILAPVDAAAGLTAAGLVLPGGEERAQRGEALLADRLSALAGRDGLPSRSPVDLAAVLERLAMLAAAYAATARPVPPAIEAHRAMLAGVLRGLVLGGSAGPWHGGHVPASTLDALLDGAPESPSAFPSSRAGGFQRLAAGGTAVVVDAAPPPAAMWNGLAHASTLAFQLAHGGVPIVVACGAANGGGAVDAQGLRSSVRGLADALRSTAAHSTLVIADTNSTRLDGRRSGVSAVEVERRRSRGGTWLDLSHDGYRRRFGYLHRRRLWLAPDGLELRGEDRLEPETGHAGGVWPVALRFHLAQGWSASLTTDGRGAVLKGRGRAGWSVKLAGPARLAVEPSLHVDATGRVHQTEQLVAVAETRAGEALSLGWAWRGPRAVDERRG